MHRAAMLRKELVAASTEPMILALLLQGETYGYAIVQEILARSQNQIAWTDGMLYPVLHRMERKKWIKARWVESETGRKRKYYSITKAGKIACDRYRNEWNLVESVFGGLMKGAHV
jgi:PadR family transcriptional regulator, regulatory protein PadR